MVASGKYRSHAELRKKPRRSFHYNAKIVTDKESPPIACAMSDVSASGARLNLENDIELPAEFILLLTPNGKARRQCRLIWRDGLSVGVKFPETR